MKIEKQTEITSTKYISMSIFQATLLTIYHIVTVDASPHPLLSATATYDNIPVTKQYTF
jgi:hypothetical protein